ncbi:hypothetical protein M9Y10_040287 [Tritrichomonas musculus]|uniref:F5/8 type C domain-containing protein n=1 Tax=Tritrichomonas musculus TaxID=1915356 RepID=A0ABR2GPP3_9EUKA
MSHQKGEEEFRFINGQQEIKMPRIFAEFFSPRVSHMHQCDPTIDYLDFGELLSNTKKKTTIFENVLNESTKNMISGMTRGENIDIEEGNEKNVRYLSVLLGNDELFNLVSDGVMKEGTIEDKIEELFVYIEIGGDSFSLESTNLIDEIASNISTENIDLIRKLPLKIIYSILRNDHFNIEDEDLLIDMINELVSCMEDEHEFSDIELYETVDLTKLSENKFREFLSTFDYTKMTGTIWKNLCECFFTTRKSKDKDKDTFEYDGDTSHRFAGIISHLRGNRQTNISDEGIVSVTASSTENPHYAKYAVAFDSDEFFHSDSKFDWLQIDFKDKKIRPTHYSIKTPSNHDDQQFPVNWCIEVSNTGNENDWRTIDTRQNVTSISKRNQSDAFEIGTRLSSNESYRYVRLRSTGNTSNKCENIAFSSLEFFGTLIQ